MENSKTNLAQFYKPSTSFSFGPVASSHVEGLGDIHHDDYSKYSSYDFKVNQYSSAGINSHSNEAQQQSHSSSISNSLQINKMAKSKTEEGTLGYSSSYASKSGAVAPDSHSYSGHEYNSWGTNGPKADKLVTTYQTQPDQARTISLLNTEIERHLRRISEQEERIKELVSELHELRAKPVTVEVRSSSELERKVTGLNLELEQTRAALLEKNIAFDSLKQRLSEVEMGHRSSAESMRIGLESQIRSQIEIQLRGQLESRLRSEIEADLRSHLGVQMKSQIEAELSSRLLEKQREIDILNEKISGLESDHLRILSETKARWENEVKMHLEKEIRNKLANHDEKVSMLAVENERLREEISSLRAELESKQEELEETRRKLSEAETKSRTELTMQISAMIESELRKKTQNYESRISELQEEIERCFQTIKTRERELSEARVLIEEKTKARSVEFESSKASWEVQIRERILGEVRLKEEEFNRIIQHLNLELETERKKAISFQEESQALQGKLRELRDSIPEHISASIKEQESLWRERVRGEMTRNSQEYESRLADLNEQLRTTKNNLQERERSVEMLQMKIRDLEGAIPAHVNEARSSWERTIRTRFETEFSGKLEQLEASIRTAHSENEQLRSQQRASAEQIEEWRRKFISLEQSIPGHINESKMQWEIMIRDTLEREYTLRVQELERKIASQGGSQNELLRELDIKENRLREMQGELQELYKRYSELEKSVPQKVQEVHAQWVHSTKQKFERELSLKADEFERKLGSVQNEHRNTIVELESRLRATLEELKDWQYRFGELERSVPLQIKEARVHWEKNVRAKFENELTINVTEYERKLASERMECDRVMAELSLREEHLRDHEIQIRQMDQRFSDLEASIPQRIQEAKSKWESTMRSRLENELTLKVSEFERHLGALRQENESILAEVQRLSAIITLKDQEIEEQMRLYADLENSIPNILRNEKSQWESSVRSRFQVELTRKIDEYESKLKSQESETERLFMELEKSQIMIREREEEIERVRIALLEKEKEIPLEISEARSQWEKEIRSRYEVELNKKLQEFDGKLAILQEDSEKLLVEIERRDQDIEGLQIEREKAETKCRELERMLPFHLEEAREKWETEMRSRLGKELSEKIKEFELALRNEKGISEQVKSALEQKERELKEWTRRFSELENSIPLMLEEARGSWEANVRSKLETHVTMQIEESDKVAKEKQMQIERMVLEIKKLEGLLHAKHSEVTEWQRKLQALEESVPQRISQVQMEWENSARAKLRVEIDVKLSEYEKKISILEAEIKKLAREVQTRESLIEDRENEIGEWRQRYSELETSIPRRIEEARESWEANVRIRLESTISEKLKQNDEAAIIVKREKEGLRILVSEKEREIESLRMIIGEKERSIPLVVRENLKSHEEQLKVRFNAELHQIMDEHDEELRGIKMGEEREKIRRKELEVEMEAMRARLRDAELENIEKIKAHEAELRLRFESELKRELDGYEAQISHLKQEINGLRVVIDQKQEEIGVWRNKIHVLEDEYNERIHAYKLQTERELKVSIEHEFEVAVGTQVQELRRELEAKIYDLVRENEELEMALSAKSSEAKSIESRLRTLGQVLPDYEETKRELEQVYEMLERKKQDDLRNLSTIDALRSELRRYQEIGHARMSVQSAGLHERINELEQRLEESEREHEKIRGLYHRNSAELAEKNKELVQKIKEVEVLRSNYEAALKNGRPHENSTIRRVITTERREGNLNY